MIHSSSIRFFSFEAKEAIRKTSGRKARANPGFHGRTGGLSLRQNFKAKFKTISLFLFLYKTIVDTLIHDPPQEP